MKLGQLKDDDFINILNKVVKCEMPFKTARKLDETVETINKEIKFFDKQRQILIDRFSDKDENGQTIVNEDRTVKFTDENKTLFIKEVNELANVDVEVPKISEEAFEKFNLSLVEYKMIKGLIDVPPMPTSESVSAAPAAA